MTSKEKNTVLIVFFSHIGITKEVGMVQKGNNEFIVEYIANYLNNKCDIYRILDPTKYPLEFNSMYNKAKNMKYAIKRPRPLNDCPNLDDYNTIFLIYPIWVEDLPMVIYSFLERNDFTNKRIIPLCTHEGSGIVKTYEKIKNILVEAEVLCHDFSMFGHETRKKDAKNEVENWLKSVGY